MCGRLLGRLLGSAQQHENGDHSAGRPVAFIAFRPLDPTGPIVPFTPGLRFRCTLCSGAGALADVEVFSTYDEPPPHPGVRKMRNTLRSGGRGVGPAVRLGLFRR